MRMKRSRILVELFDNIENGNKVYKNALYAGVEQCLAFKRYIISENFKKSLIWQLWHDETDDMDTDEFFDLDMDEWMAGNETVQMILKA